MNRYSERSARTYRGNYSTFQSRILAELPHLACDGDSAVLDLTKLQLEHVKGCLTALVHRKKADGTPDWKADALNIRQTKSKTDQTGETLRDGYHVFANPFMPEICPILALGCTSRSIR